MTTRLTKLLGSCLLVLAITACGDDGGNNPGDTCGDGQTTGAEQCDDGNTMGGDGCSATCRNESSGVCGDGVISGSEECDDNNTTSGDGCSATCETEGGVDCGNGMLDANEDCDDNNTTADDGCTGCNVDSGWTCDDAEPSVCTMTVTPNGSCQAPFEIALVADVDGDLEGQAIGDTTAAMSQAGAAPCNGDDAGLGNELVYKFTLTDTRDVLVGLTAPDFVVDPIVRVLTTPCTLNTEINEFRGADGCATMDEDGEGGLIYVALTAGTYYVIVDGFAATDAGAFQLDIFATPTTCGDGALDFFEFCDDNDMMGSDGCDAHCDVEPGYTCDTDVDPSVCVLSCGNGVVDGDDECDDDNATANDGCSATCTLEYDVLEAENNNVTPQALTAANHTIKGSLDEDDVDLYTFTLVSPARVEIETYVTIDASATYGGAGTNDAFDCDDGDTAYADTVVRVFGQGVDVTMNNLALASDDDDGDSLCSYVGTHDSADDDVVGDTADPTQGTLPAGTYTIKIVELDGVEVPRYLVSFKIVQAVAAGDLVLNEFMAADNMADTNCDGSTTDSVDEFVEIVNKGTHTVDLTGVTIIDAQGTAPRHTFAPGATGSMLLDPNKAVVVWGGGAPACPDVDNWFVSTSGNLGLNDAGDTITIATGATQLVAHTYLQQTMRVSSNLMTDIVGAAYVLHNAVVGAVGDFTPGTRANETPF